MNPFFRFLITYFFEVKWLCLNASFFMGIEVLILIMMDLTLVLPLYEMYPFWSIIYKWLFMIFMIMACSMQ